MDQKVFSCQIIIKVIVVLVVLCALVNLFVMYVYDVGIPIKFSHAIQQQQLQEPSKSISLSSPVLPPTICLSELNGSFHSVPLFYYHKIYNESILYNFACPYNSTFTSIENTISQIDMTLNVYTIYTPIIIQFTAFDIHNISQNYGGDEFLVFVNGSNVNNSSIKQAFHVEDLLNGSYKMNILISFPGIYNVFLMHIFSCFDGMIQTYKHRINISSHYIGNIEVSDGIVSFDLPLCSSLYTNQYGVNIISSGMWLNDHWSPYCCINDIIPHEIKYINQSESDQISANSHMYLYNNNMIRYALGDSTLYGSTHKVGDIFGGDSWHIWEYKRWVNVILPKDSKKIHNNHTKIGLIVNPNLHSIQQRWDLNVACDDSVKLICELILKIKKYFNLEKYELNIVVISGTTIHHQKYPITMPARSNDWVTEYRARWHDECLREKIKIFNSNPENICENISSEDLGENIWFVDITAMKIARGDVHPGTDKVHGYLDEINKFQENSLFHLMHSIHTARIS
eukprot:100158_1